MKNAAARSILVVVMLLAFAVIAEAQQADLPVQQATKFEFVVNLKAAKQIGLTIPVRVLERGE